MVLAPIATLQGHAAAALGGAALLVGTRLAHKPEGVSWGGLGHVDPVRHRLHHGPVHRLAGLRDGAPTTT